MQLDFFLRGQRGDFPRELGVGLRGQKGQRTRERAGRVAQREADPPAAVIDGQDAHG